MTPKQEQFCLSYLKEGNASEAYRQAYDAEKTKPAMINRNTKALLDNNKTVARLDQLRTEAAKESVLDRSWVIARLMNVVQIGLNAGQPCASNGRLFRFAFLNALMPRDMSLLGQCLTVVAGVLAAVVFADPIILFSI